MTVNVTLRLVGSRAGAFGSSSEETVRAAIDALLSAAGPAPAALPAAPATAAVSSNRRLLHGRRLQQRPNPEQTFNIQLPVAADQRAQTVQQLQSALQNGQLLSDLQAAGLDVSQVAEGIIDGQVVYNGPPVSPAAPPAASPGPAPGFIPVTPQPAKSGSSIAGIAGGIAGVPSSLPGESVAVHFNGAYNDESSSFDDQLPAGMLGSSAGEATQALGERLALNDGTPVHVGPEGVTDDISLIALAGIVRLREIADDAARNTGSEPSSPTAAYSHPAPAVNQQSEFQLGRAGAAGAGEGAQEKAGMDLSVANLRDVAMMLANNQDRRHFEAPANLHGAQTAIADLVTNGGEFAGRYALEGGSFSGQSVIVCTAHPMHEPNAAAVACRFYLDPKMYVRELLFLDEVPTTTSIREVFDTYDASPGSDSRTLPPCIITEHGDLSLEAWTAQRHPTAQQCIAALRTAVLAVEALHSRGLVHGSLSAACFEWFDAAESVKLVEYSTWAHAGDSVPLRLSLRTAPPEVLAAAAQSATELVADSAADMWALGLIIFELFAGEPLFGSTDDLIAMQHTDEDVVGMLLGLQPLPWESQPAFFAAIPHAGMRRLVQSLLRRGPEERPDIKQVLRHPALREVEVSGQPAKAEKPLVQPRWR
ncbi:hypothetical protein WJX72_008948 [[Myrmecia] bisecta]|uniref:non-specific serine/threonine protein kinase n=1 Tax=[Myrmecia] bisecta TaxID=41462 RepID=A0AAW1Q7Z8_9CHLO